MTTLASQWQNAHIYYYDENKDALILDCVRPLLQRLAPIVERAFFVRHWLRGPHLRVRFAIAEDDFARLARPVIEQQVTEYLKLRPSTPRIDEQAIRPVYEALAAAEHETEPVTPLYPNNSLHFLPYESRRHVIAQDSLRALIEQFYVDTTDLTFTMLDAVRAGQSRSVLCMALMVATVHLSTKNITKSFASYRSHAEVFLMLQSSNPVKTRALFDQEYAKHAATVMETVKRTLHALDHDDNANRILAGWKQIIRTYRQHVEALAAEDFTTLMPGLHDISVEQMQVWESRLKYSPFQRELSKTQWYDSKSKNIAFQRYRVMLNLCYLQLNRLGIRPFERAMLCHFIANTVEELFDLSAIEVVTGSPELAKVNVSPPS